MADRVTQRPDGRRKYISIQKHHYTSKIKDANKWVSVQIELDTFDAADYGNLTKTPGHDSWEDASGNLWGFLDNFQCVGTKKEQFGFFPITSNANDPCHGYPIIPFKRGYVISNTLIKKWIAQEVLDEDDIYVLKKGKRL